MTDDMRNWNESETDTERIVSYDSYSDGNMRARVRVHIPKRTPEQEAEYRKRIGKAVKNMYFSITKQGLDWDTITALK
ncbi:MAG: hypothetical protein J6Y64_06870 [Ruminococcus sp.]|nr:hypothetical protein [Ruminococcus sp.]